MKRKIIMILAVLTNMLLSWPVFATEFYLGEETKGVTSTVNESDLNIRVRIQPRFEFGDLTKSNDGNSYESSHDIYLRRIRLELSGYLLTKVLKYNIVSQADKWEKISNTNEVGIQYAYLEYIFDKAMSLRVGKEKLPYSRVSLTSSSKQLLIERPASTEEAKKLFGKTDAFYQPAVTFEGKLLDGILGYDLSIADGWQNGDIIIAGKKTDTADLITGVVKSTNTDQTVFQSNSVYIARIELSPPGWVESKKSDAALGKDQHLTFGIDYAVENSIQYKENNFEEDRKLMGADISAHTGGFTIQVEYNSWRKEYNEPGKKAVEPKGWYIQTGYIFTKYFIEPVARYETFNQDSNAADKTEKTTTLGINWYLKGHSLKIGLNRVSTKFEKSASGWLANDGTRDIYQMQAQLYF